MSDSLTYLQRVLSSDTELDAAEVFALRRARRKAPGSEKKSKSPKAAKDARAQVESTLAEVAEQLFEADPKDLNSRLSQLDAAAYPDLARRCSRLQEVVKARRQIDSAGAHPKTDAKLYKYLLKILRESKPEAAQTKLLFLGMLTAPHRRKAVQRTVKIWKQSFPALYRLESDWFAQLAKAKSILKSRKKPAAVGLLFFLWVLFKIWGSWIRHG